MTLAQASAACSESCKMCPFLYSFGLIAGATKRPIVPVHTAYALCLRPQVSRLCQTAAKGSLTKGPLLPELGMRGALVQV